MKYDYLIAYSFTSKDGSTGTGTMLIGKIKKIKSIKDVIDAGEFIREREELSKVAVINYQIIKRHWR